MTLAIATGTAIIREIKNGDSKNAHFICDRVYAADTDLYKPVLAQRHFFIDRSMLVGGDEVGTPFFFVARALPSSRRSAADFYRITPGGFYMILGDEIEVVDRLYDYWTVGMSRDVELIGLIQSLKQMLHRGEL